VIGQQNLPDRIAGRSYYQPTNRGVEQELAERMRRIREIYASTQDDSGEPPS
jgi:putative ATPase